MTGSDRATTSSRILMVVRLFHPWVGGTELQAQTLAQGLAARGVDVRIVTGRWFRGTPRRETIGGIGVFRNHALWEFFGIRGLRTLGGYLYMVTLWWHLWRTRGTYDVLHAHGMNYHSAVTVTTGRWLGRPTVTKLANSGVASDIEKMRQDRQLRGAHRLMRSALRSDRFVALSSAVADELRAVGIAESRIASIPNGVVIDAPPRTDYTIDGPARGVFVGRLHQQKGLRTLLEAVALVERSDPGRLRIDLIGDGPDRDAVDSQINALGLESVVNRPGATDDVGPWLRRADFFVLPSRAEGMSNALLEAMSHGLPVVVSDVPGSADIVRHGDNGLLFEVDDPRCLAANLIRVADDESLRTRIGSGARHTVESEFALDRVVDAYIALYEEMTTGRPHPISTLDHRPPTADRFSRGDYEPRRSRS